MNYEQSYIFLFTKDLLSHDLFQSVCLCVCISESMSMSVSVWCWESPSTADPSPHPLFLFLKKLSNSPLLVWGSEEPSEGHSTFKPFFKEEGQACKFLFSLLWVLLRKQRRFFHFNLVTFAIFKCGIQCMPGPFHRQWRKSAIWALSRVSIYSAYWENWSLEKFNYGNTAIHLSKQSYIYRVRHSKNFLFNIFYLCMYMNVIPACV